MNPRIKSIYAELKKQSLDCLIVSSPANITYLTGHASCDAYLLVSEEANTYFTDSRYTEAAKRALGGIAAIEKVNGSVFKLIGDACNNLGFKRVGFEEKSLTFGEYSRIRGYLCKKSDLVPVSNLVECLRQVKTESELGEIKKAVSITVSALKYIKKFLTAGRKEIEVAAELGRFIRYNGATSSSFEIIVASGANSSFPHHITSQKRIKNNEPVLIDIGVDYQGYKSDLTRVYFLGKLNSLYREIYDIVLRAQDEAIKEVRPAVNINSIDTAARRFITQAGYGSFFGHALGHGIGLEVHEAPNISTKETNKLKPGMVFTIEPGIYLPGKFGVRIEDIILVTKKGCEVLSGALNK